MTSRRAPHTSTTPQAPRPANRLFEKPVSAWYAEWKAKKAGSTPAAPPAARQQ